MDDRDRLLFGAELKIAHAQYFLEEVARTFAPPERTAATVALWSSGAVVDTQWQLVFYAALDAFLAMTRSVPDIIRACLGTDLDDVRMKAWFDGLSAEEQQRRRTFSSRFGPTYKRFKNLPLTSERHKSLHRIGYADVEVTISGQFGVVHVGRPVEPLPTATSGEIKQTAPGVLSGHIVAGDNPALQWAATLPPVAVQPTTTNSEFKGRPLMPACEEYLREAKDVLANARQIAKDVHDSRTLTSPP